MGEWHLSKYTLFYHPPEHNFLIAVNLMNASMTILNSNEIELLYDLEKLKENEDLFQRFKKQGLIVNYDELSMLDAMAKYNCTASSISLTLCPTLNCNFNCPYCFERHLTGKMTEEIQNKLVEFTGILIDISKTKSLSVCWYGGEPLLAPDVIENLSNKLMKLCDDKNIGYVASIITNGYLLTQKIVDMLNEKQVRSYQITIDGIEETHNKTRRLTNGNGTFEKIINNISTLKIEGYINIRHNVHKDNLNEVDILRKFIKILAKQSGNKLSYYPAIVAGNAAEEREGQVKILSEEEKCSLTLSKGSKVLSIARPNYCGAQLMYSFTIDNEGRLYKCWEDVDKIERSFGTIYNWNPKNPFYSATNLDMLTTYLNLSVCPKDEECRQCIWLPICRGGCPSKRIFFKKNCVPYKNNPELYLLRATERLVKKWDKDHNEQEKSRTN